ncbi:MAG TPA: winged helix-turn-helix domain-containing protein [Terracidiphilus sp.]|nr:winged helix-turn-helix domain-containing protein [Terracidiphilus sp.]
MSLIRFADFELNEQTLELHQSGAPVRIQKQPARVLAFLLNHRGSLVTREQIRMAIWGGDTFVDFDQGLNFCIRQIRRALRDDAERPLFIETLPRLGYRFVGRIETIGGREVAPTEKRIRIGVVPMDNLSGIDEDYFAAGLTEDMISALSRIDPGHLRVSAGPRLESGDGLADQIQLLHRQFNLDYLLRGSVRRSADTFRITAQLHDLRDRSVVWSETYDRKTGDLMAVQEEVTRRVSQSLALELLPSAAVGSRRYSRSSAAYDAYLKGRYFWHRMTAESLRRSMAYFNEALSLDPGFAPAYAGLADCYAQMGSFRVGQMKPLEALAQAHSHLQRALDLDETLAEAHCTLGLIKSWYDWDWNGAGREFQAALALDPSQITALIWQSLLFQATGRHKESIASVQLAREIEPLSTSVNLYLGVAQANAGQHDLAVRQLQQCIELDPGFYRPYLFLGRSLAWFERYDEAIAVIEKGRSLSPDGIESLAWLASALAGKGDRKRALELVSQIQASGERTEPAVLIAAVYARLGMATNMFEWLERAVVVKSTPIYVGIICYEFIPYFKDPRYHSFLDSIGLSHLKSI